MYTLSFQYKGKDYSFQNEVLIKLLGEIVDWLVDNGYDFSGDLHNAFTRKPLTIDEIKSSNRSEIYLKRLRHFHKMKDGRLIFIGGNIEPAFNFIKKMLVKFGVSLESIKQTESKSSKIKTFSEFDDEIDDFDEEDFTTIEEPVTKIKVYQQNPFKQAICVLGESGAGKSVTIETILENEGHNFEFIIPTAATTGLLAQFSPSKSGYVPSRLGKMLIEASKNPQKLYTAVFDEMHKSNVIEMINDELLQAISTKRNRGRRFISLDDDTAEIYQTSELDTERGNLLIPDNFGFIFISSKPRVIANNADFFNRVDIVLLKSYQEEMVETTEQLLSNKLGDEEKMKLASSRND